MHYSEKLVFIVKRSNWPIKTISQWVIVAFYISAGINHFRDPGFYYPLIPDYLPFPAFINYFSGIVEVLMGLGFGFRLTRKASSYLTILMLIAFIPSHIYFITEGGCVGEGLCVPTWVAWTRLCLIHPLFMIWAWFHRN